MDDVTLEMAIGLLELPRLLGVHPETENKIQVSLGRFGPYVVHKKGGEEGKDDYRSLKPKEGDDVLTVTLERALELFAQPKRGRGRKAAKTALRELGNHPVDGEPINIYDGPYGAYLKHNKTNVSVPEDEKVESITLEKAVALIDEKAGGPPKKKKAKKSAEGSAEGSADLGADAETAAKAAKKTTGKKASAKKTTAKKTTAKKTTAKKTTAQKTSAQKTAAQKATAKQADAEEIGSETSQEASSPVAAKTPARTGSKTAAAQKSTAAKRTTAK